ncbi:MAG: hypothetical protein L6461_02275 [Anaerolineae bacterium]|nr:hypothetical protein [Anaerolineae bacterium]
MNSLMQRFTFVCLILLFFSGCSIFQSTQIVVSETPLSPTVFVNKTPEFYTATATLEPTLTLVATLPLEIRKQNLIELFSTNGGCDLPCWWGISLGDSLQKVAELAPVIGKPLRPDGALYYYTLSLDNLNLADFDINYYVDENMIVQEMEINLVEPSRFKDFHIAFNEQLSLSGLLRRYGKPSEVLLLAEPLGGLNTPREYALFVIYDTQGFGVVYTGLVHAENPIQICSITVEDYHLKRIFLYLQEPRKKIEQLNRFYLHDLKPLESVALMSLDDFYEHFSLPDNSKCIETFAEKWK